MHASFGIQPPQNAVDYGAARRRLEVVGAAGVNVHAATVAVGVGTPVDIIFLLEWDYASSSFFARSDSIGCSYDFGKS